MPRILIVDDHPLFRDAIRDVVARLFVEYGWDFVCVEAADMQDLQRLTDGEEDFDLILLDLFMPGAQGLSQLVALRSKSPSTPVAVISSVRDPAIVRQCITCGAAGFIPKSSPKDLIATALRLVFAGGVYVPTELLDEHPGGAAGLDAGRITADDHSGGLLTARQLKVLELVAAGQSNKRIAYELSISEMTVKAHMTAILRKLGISSRSQAIVMFQRHLAGEHFEVAPVATPASA